ncbi:MAG: hypothetical protein QM684_09690 [Rhizobium sp.]|uniref:hypothetical protein n=1 Tax=Rhizobium sp. SYY.PMSO TaxID=3382192 RepID=UPI00398FC0AD
MTFWLMGVAAWSGYALLGLFLLVAAARAIRQLVGAVAHRLPRRSQLRHYLLIGTSVVFFGMLVLRGCYLAAVIVDNRLGSGPFKISQNWRGSASPVEHDATQAAHF